MTCFHRSWCLRPSCYSCHFKKKKRLSDITLADFWEIENVCSEMDDGKGTSLILIHTDRGNMLLNEIKDSLQLQAVDFETSISGNPSMFNSLDIPRQRLKFIEKISAKNFDKTIEKMKNDTLFQYYFNKCKNYVKRVLLYL